MVKRSPGGTVFCSSLLPEDPFVWVVNRKDELDVEEFEASASRCSFWQAWQLVLWGFPVAFPGKRAGAGCIRFGNRISRRLALSIAQGRGLTIRPIA